MAYKNISMANKGMGLENIINKVNEQYLSLSIADIQKISTPWKIIRSGSRIVNAFPEGKSTLDFRGCTNTGVHIAFDCKEVEKETKGLPLKNIEPHQIEFIRRQKQFRDCRFILCYIRALNKYFFIPGEVVIEYWDNWKANPRKRGYNLIPIEGMKEIHSRNGIILDYLEHVQKGV